MSGTKTAATELKIIEKVFAEQEIIAKFAPCLVN